MMILIVRMIKVNEKLMLIDNIIHLWHGSKEDIHPWKIIFLEGEYVYYSV